MGETEQQTKMQPAIFLFNFYCIFFGTEALQWILISDSLHLSKPNPWTIVSAQKFLSSLQEGNHAFKERVWVIWRHAWMRVKDLRPHVAWLWRNSMRMHIKPTWQFPFASPAIGTISFLNYPHILCSHLTQLFIYSNVTFISSKFNQKYYEVQKIPEKEEIKIFKTFFSLLNFNIDYCGLERLWKPHRGC